MVSTPDVLPADTFEGYELGDISGTGLAGDVWNARHAESGTDVAVEVIGAPLGRDHEFRRRLSAEVDRATVLDHPTIASVYEVLWAGERVGVVTDSLTSAGTVILNRDDGLPLAATLYIAEAVLRALSAAHRAGVLHAAIDRRVISVDGTNVRIGGFGVGRALRPQVPADPATDTRAVARLVVELTAGSAAARYASLPRHVRVVLARAAAAKRERHYRTAAGMRAALVNAARRDLGDDWREKAGEQLRALSAGAGAPAATRSEPASPETDSVTAPASEDASGSEDAPGGARAAATLIAPVIRAAPGELARRRTTPARSLRIALAGTALVVLALVTGVAGGLVASAVRGSAPAPAGPLKVSMPVSLQVRPVAGSCTSVFVASASGSVHGSGTLLYRWQRSDGEETATTPVTVSAKDGSFLITQHWQISGQPSHPAITFQLVSPVAMSITRPLPNPCP